MTNLCNAMGKSPPALITEVRPPIQSCIGNRASQPFFSAYLSRSLPAPVTATACLLNCSAFSLNFTSASSIPFRVSFVPPDFETTTTSVCASSSLIFSKTRSNPSGSVLSTKKSPIGSCRDPSASETNWGPSAEPPMPMSNTCLKGFPFSAVIFPAVNIRHECLDSLNRLFDLGANFRSGRQGGLPKPIMPNHSLLGGISDCPGLKRSHGCKRVVDRRLHFFEEIIREFHPADVERETGVAVIQKILLKTLPE